MRDIFLCVLCLYLILPGVFAQTLTSLVIDWSDGPLAASLGDIIVGTTIPITWDPSGNLDNLLLSVLLEQGDPSTGATVVGVPASNGVPNSGSYLWTVGSALPSGGNYFVRLQTGTSSDWGGGLNNTEPSPGAVYGLAGHFALVPPPTITTSIVSTTAVTASPTTSPPEVTSLTIDWSDSPLVPDMGTILAGSTIPITWSPSGNPDDLLLSVLLERGDPSTVATLVDVVANRSIPNSGSFLWSVDNALSSGGNYFIRMQTGSSSDFAGGLNTSEPSPGAVFGLAGRFSIRGPVASAATQISASTISTTQRTTSTTHSTRSTTSNVPHVTTSTTVTPVPTASTSSVTVVLTSPTISSATVAVTSPTVFSMTTAHSTTSSFVPPPPPAVSPSSPTISASVGSSTRSIVSTASPASSTTPVLSTLNIDWSHSSLGQNLGSVVTGSQVNILWDTTGNSRNLSLALLLERQDPNTTPTLVNIPASSGIPNTGSYLWNVNNALPPGNNYFIRLQTGTASDWGGGTGMSDPTPGAVYGLAGFFTVNFTSGSGALVTATVTATNFVTCCKGETSKASKIAGSVIGSLIGLALLFTAGFFATRAKPPLPGPDPSQDRTFVFLPPLALGAGHAPLGETKIILSLMPWDSPPGAQPIAWQVFDVHENMRTFRATLPHNLGFGSVNVEDTHDQIANQNLVRTPQFKYAPPGWLLSIKYNEGIEFTEPSKFFKSSKNQILVQNDTNISRKLAIGSYHIDEAMPILQPFLLLDAIAGGKQLNTRHTLILQAYVRRGGIRRGGKGKKVTHQGRRGTTDLQRSHHEESDEEGSESRPPSPSAIDQGEGGRGHDAKSVLVGQILTEEVLRGLEPLLPENLVVGNLPPTTTWRLRAGGPDGVILDLVTDKAPT